MDEQQTRHRQALYREIDRLLLQLEQSCAEMEVLMHQSEKHFRESRELLAVIERRISIYRPLERVE